MILFYLLITVLPLTQHPLWSRFIGDFTVIKYLGLVCVIYAGLAIMGGSRPPALMRTWQARFFLLFIALATVSFFALTGRVAWETSVLMIFVSLLMLFVTTLTLVTSLSRLYWTLAALLGGLAVASLYVLREYQGTYTAGINQRPGYVVGDPNYFTISALFAIPVAFSLMRERRPRWNRAYCITCLVLILLAVTVAASRGGFLGLCAGLLFALWNLPNRTRNFGVVAALILPLSILSPVSPLQRLATPTFSDRDAADSRYQLWDAGLKMFQANPVFGVGVMNFKPLSTTYQDSGRRVEAIAHNTYIELAAEMGITGLVTFWAVWAATMVSLHQTRKQAVRLSNRLLHHAALGLQSGLVGYAVAAFFVSAEYQRLYWFSVFLSASLSRLVSQAARRSLRRQERKPSAPVS